MQPIFYNASVDHHICLPNVNLEHIGWLARMSVLDTEVDGSNPAAVCCFLGQDTLSTLLQSTEL